MPNQDVVLEGGYVPHRAQDIRRYQVPCTDDTEPVLFLRSLRLHDCP